jgi:4-amino-4-deoxy-L-arabinose transferase-like glycosyltransferase
MRVAPARIAWSVVALVTLARCIAAFTVPLTGDEAYYWEWSRRLAFGYADHPPGVAWTIAAFSWLGQHAWAVRIGFVACGALAALALSACATLLAGGDRRAGAIAAIAFTLAPLCSVAFTAATPDGPYLLFWCVSLYCAARAFRDGTPLWWALLGLALGGALLSRMLALALIGGLVLYALLPARRRAWRGGFWIGLAVTAAVFAPFVLWNAANGWETFAFTFLHRQETTHGAFSLARGLSAFPIQAVAFSPAIWIAAAILIVRPINGLLEATALPLALLLTALSFVRPVEVYWMLGPFASLCAMIGVAYTGLAPKARAIWATCGAIPAALMLVLLFAAAFVPGPIYGTLASRGHLQLKNSGPFEVFTFAPLARDVAKLASERGVTVMTDGYGFSSILDFEAGVFPVVIGYDWQGRESRRWYLSSRQPSSALFVDKEPLDTRPDIALRLARACTSVSDGGVRAYAVAGAPARRYYLTWCRGIVPGGLAILRWERNA